MEKETINFSIPSLSFNLNTVYPTGKWRGIHRHSAAEIISANGGKLLCFADGKEITLTPEKLVLINGQIPHRIKNISADSATYIQFEILRTKKNENSLIFDFIQKSKSDPFYIFDKNDELSKIFFEITKEAKEKKPFYKDYIRSYLYKISACMCRHGIIKSSADDLSDKISQIKPLCDFAEKNFMYPLPLDLLAQKTGVGKFELCRKFKKITGGTVVDFINYIRLKNAEEKLADPKKNITETALECGFSSVQYFNKVFKGQYGCPPGAYKKNSKDLGL